MFIRERGVECANIWVKEWGEGNEVGRKCRNEKEGLY